MADPQRTHAPTPKRVKEFRKRGEIALSRDLVSAAALGGGVVAVLACSGMATTALIELTRAAASSGDGGDTAGLGRVAVHTFLVAAGPVMVGAGLGALVSILGQLGWPPAFKRPTFDLGRLSPLKNLATTFAPAQVVRRTGLALAKLVAVGALVTLVIERSVVAHALDAGSLMAVATTLIRRALWLVVGALAALGAIDYYVARRKIFGQMKMSADELRREHKESEGDPMLRGKRKARMRELAKRRMAANVAKADVVVVNPTHYAVALRYDETTDHAPLVVAKGVDEAAEKIREIARTHGVPILERPPLARALHKHVKEGRPVPANLYRAVAEVLAYVYRLRRRGNA